MSVTAIIPMKSRLLVTPLNTFISSGFRALNSLNSYKQKRNTLDSYSHVEMFKTNRLDDLIFICPRNCTRLNMYTWVNLKRFTKRKCKAYLTQNKSIENQCVLQLMLMLIIAFFKYGKTAATEVENKEYSDLI